MHGGGVRCILDEKGAGRGYKQLLFWAREKRGMAWDGNGTQCIIGGARYMAVSCWCWGRLECAAECVSCRDPAVLRPDRRQPRCAAPCAHVQSCLHMKQMPVHACAFAERAPPRTRSISALPWASLLRSSFTATSTPSQRARDTLPNWPLPSSLTCSMQPRRGPLAGYMNEGCI